MKHENISEALDYIDDDILAAAQKARHAKTRRRFSAGKLAAAAAAVMIVIGTTAMAADGKFVEIKNRFGAVTGGQYVNATDDIRVTALSNKSGGVNINTEIVEPAKPPFSSFDKFRIYTYTITDECGNIIAECSKKNGTLNTLGGDPLELIHFPEDVKQKLADAQDLDGDGWISMKEEAGIDFGLKVFVLRFDYNGSASVCVQDSREYTTDSGENAYAFILPTWFDGQTLIMHIESFIGESKGDQPLEVFGDWEVEFTF